MAQTVRPERFRNGNERKGWEEVHFQHEEVCEQKVSPDRSQEDPVSAQNTFQSSKRGRDGEKQKDKVLPSERKALRKKAEVLLARKQSD